MSRVSQQWGRVSGTNLWVPILVEADGTQVINITALSYTTDSITCVESLATALDTLAKLTITAGTSQAFASSVAEKHVIVYARPGNTGTIYVGGPNVTNAGGARPGVPLDPGGREIFPVANANVIYVDADVSNDIAYAVAV